MEPEKQPLLSNGCVTRNNGVNVGRGVFYAVRAEDIYRGPASITKSYKIIKMQMFATLEKAKPDTGYIRGLNLAAVKHTTV
jgi:hypothetical protein